MRGIVVKIKALLDCNLRTYYESHDLIKDEVKSIRFKNINTVTELLKFKNFVLARPDEEEVRSIPVLWPEVDEDVLVAVENGQVLRSGIDVEDEQILLL